MNFTHLQTKSYSDQHKDFTSDEETSKEKDSKGKTKLAEEKFFSKNLHSMLSYCNPAQTNSYLSYCASLNVHPVKDDDIQPPCAA